MTEAAQVNAAVAAAREAFGGRIDILHNNVGITSMGGPVEESLESWEHVMRSNLTGAFLTCKAVLPVMIEQGKGAIVNISSLAAIRYTGYPYSSYYASKAGLNHFTIGLALQYARQGIRANVIMPGLMNHAADPSADLGPVREHRGHDEGARRSLSDGPDGDAVGYRDGSGVSGQR